MSSRIGVMTAASPEDYLIECLLQRTQEYEGDITKLEQGLDQLQKDNQHLRSTNVYLEEVIFKLLVKDARKDFKEVADFKDFKERACGSGYSSVHKQHEEEKDIEAKDQEVNKGTISRKTAGKKDIERRDIEGGDTGSKYSYNKDIRRKDVMYGVLGFIVYSFLHVVMYFVKYWKLSLSLNKEEQL